MANLQTVWGFQNNTIEVLTNENFVRFGDIFVSLEKYIIHNNNIGLYSFNDSNTYEEFIISIVDSIRNIIFVNELGNEIMIWDYNILDLIPTIKYIYSYLSNEETK